MKRKKTTKPQHTYIVHVTGPAGRDWVYVTARNSRNAKKQAQAQGLRVVYAERECNNLPTRAVE